MALSYSAALWSPDFGDLPLYIHFFPPLFSVTNITASEIKRGWEERELFTCEERTREIGGHKKTVEFLCELSLHPLCSLSCNESGKSQNPGLG